MTTHVGELRLPSHFSLAPRQPKKPQSDEKVPLSTREMVEMLRQGTAQGFHVNYFYKGHGPTDFGRWAAAATEETATGKGKTGKGVVLFDVVWLMWLATFKKGRSEADANHYASIAGFARQRKCPDAG